MPNLSIEEQRGKITTPPFAVLKDGKEFAYAANIMAARAIKVALEDWYRRNPRPDGI